MRILIRRLAYVFTGAFGICLGAGLLVPASAGAVLGCGDSLTCIVTKVAAGTPLGGAVGVAGGAVGVAKGLGGVVSGVASGAIGGVISGLAQDILDCLNQVLAAIVTFWVHVPTPDLASGGGAGGVPTQPSAAVGFLRGSLALVTGLIAACSLIYGGARLVVEQRRGGAAHDAGYQLVHGMLRLVVVSAGSVAVVYVFVQAG